MCGIWEKLDLSEKFERHEVHAEIWEKGVCGIWEKWGYQVFGPRLHDSGVHVEEEAGDERLDVTRRRET